MPIILTSTFNSTPPAPSTYSDIIVADTPLHYWRLGESSGTVGIDEISGSNGTYSAGIVSASGLLANDSDTAAQFNTGDYMSIPTVNNAGDYSLECWINVNSIVTGRQSFFYTATADVFGLRNGQLNFYQSGDNSGATVLSINTIYHVVYVKTGATGEFFLNGVSDGTININSNTGFNTIAANSGSTEPLLGVMDEAAIYDYALTAATVLTHYNAGI